MKEQFSRLINSVMLRLLYIGVNTVTQLKSVMLNNTVNTLNTLN